MAGRQPVADALQAPPALQAPQAPQAFGGFWLGALPLALPMAALREVVPLGDLQPLPCPAACVLGGITLRGVTVPVVDLRLALGQPAQPPVAGACVIVMVEAGCILGLLADGATGVFNAGPDGISHMQLVAAAQAAPVHGLAPILAGTVRDSAGGAALMLLSPAALARLPQVPMVVDPEPQRQHLSLRPALGAPGRTAAAARPVMLMRCGRMPLAIDAMGVHATLAHPQVQPSPLAMGHCRGVIAHDGQHLPLVDLLALCGLGTADLSGSFQAFIVRLDAGLVAFAVDEVVDVVRVADTAVVPVPAFALPHPALFAGALPMAALPVEVVARAATPAHQFLLLDAQALKADADVAGLAGTNTPVVPGTVGTPGGRAPATAPAGQRPRRNMITFALAGETATPIEQVAEILPYAPEATVFAGSGALLGMVVNRGRSIPVLCMRQLQGLPHSDAAAANVLVVDCDGALIGFAVPQLRSIEPADWPLNEADLRAAGHGGPLNTRALARVGSGDQQRLLRVLDLHQLARGLQASGRALAA